MNARRAMSLPIGPMSAASPDMSAEGFTALKASIAREGQLVPIVVYRGQVLDGRKRLRACEELGIPPQTLTISDTADPATRAEALNLIRTHYSDTQRAMYAGRVAKLARGQTKPSKGEISTSAPVTQREAAKQFGVVRSAIGQAKRIHRQAIPEVIAATEAGKLSLYAARTIAERPQAEQLALLTRALAAKGDNKRMTSGTLVSRKGYRRKRAGRVIPRALAALGHHADLLEEYITAGVPASGDRREWAQRIVAVADILRRILHHLKEEGHGKGGSDVSRADRMGAGAKDRNQGTGPAAV